MYKEFSFDNEYQAYILEDEEGYKIYGFISRYYANKWIKDHVSEINQKLWKVCKINGYYRIFRFIEYEF